MKRRNFIKTLLGTIGGIFASSIPIIAKQKNDDEEFTFDDLFEICDTNNNLYFLKSDSWLNKELIKIADDKYVDEKYFMYYLPARELVIPVKEKYNKKDFESLSLYLTKYTKYEHRYFTDDTNRIKKHGLFRLLKDRNGEFFSVIWFEARKPNYS